MDIDSKLKEKMARLNELSKNTLAEHLGIVWESVSKTKIVASMPVNERTRQPFGILHGGASVALAETVASIGAWLNVDDSKQKAVGIEINANHIRPQKSGRVIATAEPIHLGRTTQVWSIEIKNEEGKLVCTSRCTLAVVASKS